MSSLVGLHLTQLHFINATANEPDWLLGNVFLFLLAGHETTAHTMAIALGLLALYPEVQNKLAEQIKQVESEHESPVGNQFAT